MTLPASSPKNKNLILGTALWGWGVDKSTAYELLDNFVSLGGKVVDTATNYPINKRPEDYGLALNWISEWLAMSGRSDIFVITKIGAVDNMGSNTVNLTPSFIYDTKNYLFDRLGSALAAIAIHWDNRGNNADIDATINAFSEISSSDLSIGFSGVENPQLYLDAAPDLAGKWWIQVKENALSDAARQHYSLIFPNAHYLAYGINMGGIKLEPPSDTSSIVLRSINRHEGLVERLANYLNSKHVLSPPPSNLNELALTTSFLNPALSGVIIGPRNVAQLRSTLSFWSRLRKECKNENFVQLP